MPDFPETLGATLECICQRLQDAQAAVVPILEHVLRQEEAARALAAAIIKPALKGEAAAPSVMPYLLDRGWYVTYQFPIALFTDLEALMQAGSHDEVDRLMCDLARERLAEVEKALRARFPNREPFFVDAFQAHGDGKYTLSIPAFLAQADGVGCEVLGVPRQFFKAKKRVRAIDQKLAAVAPYVLTGIKEAMLSPLREESSLAAATEERDTRTASEPWFGPLNRHGVQHGLDLDYQTEGNSLRCITLLDYLLDVDRILRREIPKEVAELNRKWRDLLSKLEQARSSAGRD